MSKLYIITDTDAPIPVSFDEGRGALKVEVEGAPRGARVSFGDRFSTLVNGRTKIELSGLEDGEYTLFIHEDKKSTPAMQLAYRGGILAPIVKVSDYLALNRALAKQKGQSRELDTRIAALEKSVFSPLLF